MTFLFDTKEDDNIKFVILIIILICHILLQKRNFWKFISLLCGNSFAELSLVEINLIQHATS